MREFFTSPASLTACRQPGVEGCREVEEGVGETSHRRKGAVGTGWITNMSFEITSTGNDCHVRLLTDFDSLLFVLSHFLFIPLSHSSTSSSFFFFLMLLKSNPNLSISSFSPSPSSSSLHPWLY